MSVWQPSWRSIADGVVAAVQPMRFGQPVTHVYNPLVYARAAYDRYCKLYGRSPKKIVLLGMNPGPWGMVQTGIPFGDRQMVQEWLGIEADIARPDIEHPKRPVQGFDCTRSETSGKRLWGWARDRFKTSDRFFETFFVANYCPLAFMEESGRNRTPDKLKKHEKESLFEACDTALLHTVELLQPTMVVGVGRFAAQQAERALVDKQVRIGRISHPSPANPKANSGWAQLIEAELAELGIKLQG